MKRPAAFRGGRFGPNGIKKIPKALGMYMDPNLSKSGEAETNLSQNPLAQFGILGKFGTHTYRRYDMTPRTKL